MKTLEVHQQKVIETKALLLEVIKEPTSFKENESFKAALKSQGGLAKFTDEGRGIATCSLNTLKSASETLLDRGFSELDELRIKAKGAIEGAIESRKANKSTRTGLRHKVDSLEEQLNVMQKSNFLLTMMVGELRSELKNMAYTNESLEQKKVKYQEINRKIEAKLNYTLDGDV